MADILLSTLNARYSHASLGLRYLRANLGDLREDSAIMEFVIGQKTEEIVEKILAGRPRILGLGVYIWNVEESTRLVAQLKIVAPELIIVLGGPEVSYEVGEQRICALADYVITGWGDVTFAWLVERLLCGDAPPGRIRCPGRAEGSGAAVCRIYRRGCTPTASLRRSVARLPVQMRILPVVPGQDRLAVRAEPFPG